uniref:LNS2/PITP domain-containing protein n=1 Tax=Hemiselmis andersenii TaxID=464988 RepID=A0A6U5CU96_HEMAN|mmetsp:Transcript_36168/g.84720  ORF Transcript_36168/g.84720 Transcript_36168/m.84720 type:complete len:446 (+) Transcript_36168:249-1586(+)
MMKGMARRMAGSVGSSLWEGTSKFTDTGGGATDVVAVRHPSGHTMCSSFHAQLPRLSKVDMMGSRVQLFVNNLPTHILMVLDRDNICCFDDGSYKPAASELDALNLRPGRNSLRYELIHPLNNDRKFSVKADLHLWMPHDKVVIVDIDGTVTKTDVAGYGAAKLGYEYTHAGVCECVTVIARQGYKVLFLTSRAITLAQSTREFLRSIGFSNGGCGMPEFCLITTTETFLPSLIVGVRGADKFKTAALQEIVTAFAPEVKIRQSSSEEKVPGWRMDTSPQMSHHRTALGPQLASNLEVRETPADDEEQASQNSTLLYDGSDSDKSQAPPPPPAHPEGAASPGAPGGRCSDPLAGGIFVAGFGNRLTDTAAYAAVGVPTSHNFLIDERSLLKTMSPDSPAAFDGYLTLLPHIQRLLPALSPEGVPLGGAEGKGTCPFDCDCDLLVL